MSNFDLATRSPSSYTFVRCVGAAFNAVFIFVAFQSPMTREGAGSRLSLVRTLNTATNLGQVSASWVVAVSLVLVVATVLSVVTTLAPGNAARIARLATSGLTVTIAVAMLAVLNGNIGRAVWFIFAGSLTSMAGPILDSFGRRQDKRAGAH